MSTPLRRTTQRQAVLRAVKTSGSAVTASQVLRLTRASDREIGVSTVYRNLRMLQRNGEIVVVEADDGVKRYLGHSHHEAVFTCQRCGRTRRLTSRTLDGYVQRKMLGRQEVFFSRLVANGLCTTCTRNIVRR